MPSSFTPDNALYLIGGVQYPRTYSAETDYASVPPKVSGTWISYPDGSRFRKPTSYSRSRILYTRGSSEKTIGVRSLISMEPQSCTTGPGGVLFNICRGRFNNYASRYGVFSLQEAPNLALFDKSEAATKCLNKMADGTAQLGENLATMGQTARMIIQPSQALLREIHKFRADKRLMPLARRSYRDLIRGGTSEKLASLYLQYVYGVKPLMQDIHNIMAMMKEQGIKPLILSAHHNVSSSFQLGRTSYDDVSYQRDESVEGADLASRSRCALWAKLSPEWQALRSLNQLGLLNPASLAWELVPYSFVVDWFLPIGSMLGALSAPAGLDFVGGSESRTVAIAGRIQNSHRKGEYARISSQTPATAQFYYQGYTRQALSSWPRPGVYFDTDPLGLRRDGSDRVLKALALATVKLPRL